MRQGNPGSPYLIETAPRNRNPGSRKVRSRNHVPSNVQVPMLCRLLPGFDMPRSFKLWGGVERHPTAGFLSTQRPGYRNWRRNGQQQPFRHQLRSLVQRQLYQRNPGNSH